MGAARRAVTIAVRLALPIGGLGVLGLGLACSGLLACGDGSGGGSTTSASGTGGSAAEGAGGQGGQTGGQGGTGGHAGQAGGGGTGGAPECQSPTDCAGQDSECATRTCTAGKCGLDLAPASTTCTVGGDVCDGAGNCVKSVGFGCEEAAECLSGVCEDKICCDAPCPGLCRGCNVEGFAGSCQPQLSGTDPDDECALTAVCDGSGACAAGNYLASGGGWGNSDEDHAWSVAVDKAGSVLLTGYFKGFINPGGGWLSSATSRDVLVVKLDDKLAYQWAKRYGDASEQRGNGVAVDSNGNVLLTGIFKGTIDFGAGPLVSANSTRFDIFVAKLDPTGKALWSKRLGNGTADQASWRITTVGADDVVVVGQVEGSVDFGGGPVAGAGLKDVFVLRLDSQGAYVAASRHGDAGDQQACAVAVDAGGDLVLAGYFKGNINFGGGNLTSAAAGKYDLFLAKLTAGLQHVWSKRFGNGLDDQYCGALATDPAKGIVLVGDLKGSVDFGGGAIASAGNTDGFVAKFDAGGTHLWSARYGDASAQTIRGVGTDSVGNVTIVGHHQGAIDLGGGPLTSAGSWDIFLGKLSPSGAHLWSKRFGDAAAQYATDAVLDATGAVAFTGYFAGTLSLGGMPLKATGTSDDIYVATFGP